MTPAGRTGSTPPSGAQSWAAAIPVSTRPGLHAFRWKSKQWAEQALLLLNPPPSSMPCSDWTWVNGFPSCRPGLAAVSLSHALTKIEREIKNWGCFMGHPDTPLRRPVVKVLNPFPFALHKDFHLGHNIAFFIFFMCSISTNNTCTVLQLCSWKQKELVWHDMLIWQRHKYSPHKKSFQRLKYCPDYWRTPMSYLAFITHPLAVSHAHLDTKNAHPAHTNTDTGILWSASNFRSIHEHLIFNVL